MTFTKADLKGLKAEGTKLEKKVINVLLDQGNSADIENYMSDVTQHGCQSGIVGELIYYTDTVAFFEKYKRDIITLLTDTLKEFGYNSPAELFGNSWEDEDPFAEDTHNQNLLSWFAFEEITRNIGSQLGMDI